MPHNIYDSDTRFIVDPFTKALNNISTQKSRLIQNDHNSEVITFELPRYIEGHDMSLCNVAQVHYINQDSKSKEQSASIYDMWDLRVDPEDEDKVLCSWLVSHNATKYAGGLSFALRFACIENDGTVQYAWHTSSYTGFVISEGVYIDGKQIIDNNIDILNQYITLIKNIISQRPIYELTEEDKANIVALVLEELENETDGGSIGGSGGESTEPIVKTFTLEGFGNHTSTDNGDNTFNFKEGMTWGEWKASTYNSWDHSNYGEFKFETYHNGTVSIDVGCNPDTPIEGVCNADGTPVKDSEVIQAITYLYVDDLDWYGYEEDSGDSGDSGGSGETHTAYMETCYANGVGSYTFEFTDGQTVGDIFEDVCCPACGLHLEGVTEDTVLEPEGHYYCPNY